MPETLLLNITDQIATITFNRPDSMNSFNKTMADELKEITAKVGADDNIRTVIVNGSGKLFMPGGDLHFFYERLDKMPAGVLDIVCTLNASIINLMQMPKPVIASVHGSVAGAGVSLMAACDLVIAAENTKFTLAYSNIGLSPDGGATYTLPRIVGVKKAMEWMLLSEVFDANSAKSAGLINWIVPENQLTQETNRIAAKLAKGPTNSYAGIKRLTNQTWSNSLQLQLDNEATTFESCTMTSDFRSGVTGFLQKKAAVFEGK